MACFSFWTGSAVSAVSLHLADVAESKDVWHRGGFVGGQDYFARLLVELHTKLVQAEDSGFRGSA